MQLDIKVKRKALALSLRFPCENRCINYLLEEGRYSKKMLRLIIGEILNTYMI